MPGWSSRSNEINFGEPVLCAENHSSYYWFFKKVITSRSLYFTKKWFVQIQVEDISADVNEAPVVFNMTGKRLIGCLFLFWNSFCLCWLKPIRILNKKFRFQMSFYLILLNDFSIMQCYYIIFFGVGNGMRPQTSNSQASLQFLGCYVL